jgi:AcrR family transcriptional regulator
MMPVPSSPPVPLPAVPAPHPAGPATASPATASYGPPSPGTAANASPATAVAASAAATEPVPPPRRPGRPRSEHADQAIIDATLEEFARCGPDGLCIEQVAARAGVGKATIYRRWPGKEDLLLEAIGALRTPLPQPQGRSVRADLTALVEALCKEVTDPRRARQFALLHGDGLKYPRLVARYNQLVMQPRRDFIALVLRRGLATGELREDTDVDAATFLLTGAVLARGGSGGGAGGGGPRETSDARYARRVVEELLRGLAAR